MDTTTAAAQAGVTVATIRTWCRRNAIAAAKRAGRWIIDAASLTHRIHLGRKTVPDAPVYLTSKTRRVRGHIAAVGPAAQLKAAFENGTPVTLSGKHAGERVYLGHRQQTYGDYGITLETIGEDNTWTAPDGREAATYLIDFTRLDDAPRLAAMVAEVENERARAVADMQARVAAEERELERSEDGA